jgi:dipeptidase E
MDGYALKAQARFKKLGYELDSIHRLDAKARPQSVSDAEALFIGGGNTFRLLNALYRDDLISAIRSRVAQNIPFVGSSAGAIVPARLLKRQKTCP